MEDRNPSYIRCELCMSYEDFLLREDTGPCSIAPVIRSLWETRVELHVLVALGIEHM
jgi:hypothetical protein